MFIGLDGETTGKDITKGSALIQIGAAIYREGQFYSTHVTFNPKDPDMVWSKEAEAVHNITLEEVQNAELDASQVDDFLYNWFIKNKVNPKDKYHNFAVGWNVASFDMPYVKKYLPKTFKLFSYSSVDLNSVCVSLDGKKGHSAETWKAAAKRYARTICPEREGYRAHNAEWDSVMSLGCFNFLRKVIDE
jgi:DNA polymerase III epsilon subunit-like protein